MLVQESGESRLLVTVGHVRAHPLQHLLWAGGGRGRGRGRGERGGEGGGEGRGRREREGEEGRGGEGRRISDCTCRNWRIIVIAWTFPGDRMTVYSTLYHTVNHT